jgi:hypothetical protein
MLRKTLKDMFAGLSVLALILMAHALPEMAIRIIPTWLLVVSSVAFILALAVFALWCLKQVIRLSREDY